MNIKDRKVLFNKLAQSTINWEGVSNKYSQELIGAIHKISGAQSILDELISSGKLKEEQQKYAKDKMQDLSRIIISLQNAQDDILYGLKTLDYIDE